MGEWIDVYVRACERVFIPNKPGASSQLILPDLKSTSSVFSAYFTALTWHVYVGVGDERKQRMISALNFITFKIL